MTNLRKRYKQIMIELNEKRNR